MASKDEPYNLYKNAIPFKQAAASPRPRRNFGRPVDEHKFKVGQTLLFSPSIFEAATQRGAYCVVGLLPADGGDNQYRLKCAADGHERVVRESQLALV
jgi:hypothetical protein